MAASDTKKVQTMINIAGQQMEIIRAAVAALDEIRTIFIALDPAPDVTGTVLSGNKSLMNSSLTAIKAQTDLAVWDTLISGIEPTHTLTPKELF